MLKRGRRAAPHLSLPHGGGGREVTGGHPVPRVTPTRQLHSLPANRINHLLHLMPEDVPHGCAGPEARRDEMGREGEKCWEDIARDRRR